MEFDFGATHRLIGPREPGDGDLLSYLFFDEQFIDHMRSSYGLRRDRVRGDFKIKPLEIVHFGYQLHEVDSLTQAEVDAEIDRHDGIVCWTVGRRVVLEHRDTAERRARPWLADLRRFGWAQAGAFIGKAITRFTTSETATRRTVDVDIPRRVPLSEIPAFELTRPCSQSNSNPRRYANPTPDCGVSSSVADVG